MDASEMIEIEMLEAEIGRLKIDNQTILGENQRLRSASDLQERAQSGLTSELHLLRSKMERMEKNFGKILWDHAIREQDLKSELTRVAGERDALRAELDLKNEEVETLFLDLQEQEKTNQEDQVELRKVKAELSVLLEQKEGWDDRVDKITEDNTVIILTMLASQNDLEEQLNRKEAVMEALHKKVLEMVRRMRSIVMAGEEEEGWRAWNEGQTSGERDDEIGNVVKVMVSPVEQELKEIEAALATTRPSLRGKETVEEEAEEEEEEDEMETMITWRPTRMVEGSWGRKGKSKDYWRQKGDPMDRDCFD